MYIYLYGRVSGSECHVCISKLNIDKLFTLYFEFLVAIENHVVVGSLLETKGAQVGDMSTPKSINGDVNWGPDSETNQATGGYSVGFSLAVLQVCLGSHT